MDDNGPFRPTPAILAALYVVLCVGAGAGWIALTLGAAFNG
ncbi:hypothetical protein [Pikeienuella sp. HZG-20]